MALIKCPECNNDVSDKAKGCPHCGYELPQQEPKGQGYYCPKCLDVSNHKCICTYCKTEMRESIFGTTNEIFNYTKNHPELKTTPAFDYSVYNKRINYVPPLSPFSNVPKCPTCQSTNIHRISSGERAVSIIGLGIFSKKINKSFKCNGCGCTW